MWILALLVACDETQPVIECDLEELTCEQDGPDGPVYDFFTIRSCCQAGPTGTLCWVEGPTGGYDCERTGACSEAMASLSFDLCGHL